MIRRAALRAFKIPDTTTGIASDPWSRNRLTATIEASEFPLKERGHAELSSASPVVAVKGVVEAEEERGVCSTIADYG